MEGHCPVAHCGASGPMDEPGTSFSLTYSEIGERLCRCVAAGILTMEQAQEIGNYLFPVLSD